MLLFKIMSRSKYFNTFSTTSEYEDYIYIDNVGYPNVAAIEADGSVKYVKEKHDYSLDYLTTTALESGTISLNVPSGLSTSRLTSISYSIDNGSTWITTQYDNTNSINISLNVNEGDKILWKGVAGTLSKSKTSGSMFSSTCNFVVSGNIMSLLYGDNFVSQTTLSQNNNFARLFQGCTKLVSISNLILPATTLAMQSYYHMFYGCSLIDKVTCYATNISQSGCLTDWLKNVSETGTFKKDANTTYPEGSSGIPVGWTIINM